MRKTSRILSAPFGTESTDQNGRRVKPPTYGQVLGKIAKSGNSIVPKTSNVPPVPSIQKR